MCSICRRDDARLERVVPAADGVRLVGPAALGFPKLQYPPNIVLPSSYGTSSYGTPATATYLPPDSGRFFRLLWRRFSSALLPEHIVRSMVSHHAPVPHVCHLFCACLVGVLPPAVGQIWLGEVVDPAPADDWVPSTIRMTWAEPCDVEVGCVDALLLLLESRRSTLKII